jgi:hypothetical protein
MKIDLKENVIYETFPNRNRMMEKIVEMIMDSRTDKILYKGKPNEINYKLMKKVLLKDYTKKIDPDLVKDMYDDITMTDGVREFCIIYKK